MLLTSLLLLACATPPTTTAAPTTRTVTLTLTLPASLPQAGVITTIPFTAAEVAAHAHQDPGHVYEWFARLKRADDRDKDAGTVTIDVVVPGGDVVVEVFDDTDGNGLETLFGGRPSIGSALVEVKAGATTATAAFTAPPPPKEPREPCKGERLEKLVLEGKQIGKKVVCVYLPADYATSKKNYPVVFALPGFSGNAVDQDGFGARGLFDDVAKEVGTSAIVVGVETRTPAGTSYLSGAWEDWFAGSVVTEIEHRYRTTKKHAVYGHSTGGWNALSIALRRPDVFAAAAASSPDPVDLDLWLFDGAQLRTRWRDWAVAEHALGGRGQFTSWAASWSPEKTGAKDLVDDKGNVDRDVYARWKAWSPLAYVQTPAGQAAAKKLSGHLFITAGSADMFDLYRPSESFVQQLKKQSVDVEWVPTPFDHFGHSERFRPLVRFLLLQLKDS